MGVTRTWCYVDLRPQYDVGRGTWEVPFGNHVLPQYCVVERTRVTVTAWGPTGLATSWYPNDMTADNSTAVVYAKYGYRTGPGDNVIGGVWPDLGDNPNAQAFRPVVVSSLVPQVQRLAYQPSDGTPVYSWVLHADTEASDSHAQRHLEDTASGLPIQGPLLCVGVSLNGTFGPTLGYIPGNVAGWAAILLASYY